MVSLDKSQGRREWTRARGEGKVSDPFGGSRSELALHPCVHHSLVASLPTVC